MSIRPVRKLTVAKPTLEGAGVHLRRAFGFGQTKEFEKLTTPELDNKFVLVKARFD